MCGRMGRAVPADARRIRYESLTYPRFRLAWVQPRCIIGTIKPARICDLMSVETWRPAARLTAEFVQLLPSFEAGKGLADWAEDYARGHAGRCQWDARFLATHYPSQRYLNIGGAPFLFEFALRRENPAADITSVDLDPARFPGAGNALEIRIVGADIESPTADIAGAFDCVVFAEILEHLRIDLLGTLARVRDVLTPGGVLYVTTPNGLGFEPIRRHYLRGRTGPSVVGEWGKLARLGHMGHVREYSAREMKEVLEYAGFRIETCLFREGIGGRWLLRDLLLKLRPSLASELVIVCRKPA